MNYLNEFLENKEFSTEKIKHEYEVIITRLLEEFGEDLEGLEPSKLLQFIDGPLRVYEVAVAGAIVKKKYAFSTYEKNITKVRSFFNYLFNNNLITIDYASYIETVEQKRILNYEVLPGAKEIQAILELLHNEPYKTDYYAMRNLVVFNLIFHSGLSTEELSSLNTNDAGLDGINYVLTPSKPSERTVKVNSDDAKLLSHLLQLRETISAKDNALFLSVKNKTRMPRRSIGYIINKTCDEAGIKVYSPEKFKKAGIAAALSHGYPVESMAEDLSIKADYFKNRVRYAKAEKVVNSYADLFVKKE